MTILIAVLVFGTLVFVHEFGHFFTARLFGVTVREFAIGMGPTLFSFRGKPDADGNRTKYALRLLPLGGFVSMDGEDEASDNKNAFCNKKVWQRLIIVSAGALTNLITGILCMVILVCTLKGIGGTTVRYYRDEPPVTALMEGDRILSVDGKKVHVYFDLQYTISRQGTKPVDVVIERGGKEMVLKDISFATKTAEGVTFGQMDFTVYTEERTFGNVARQAYWYSVTSIRMVWESLVDLVSGRFGIEAVSGPVGVAGALSDAAKSGAQDLTFLVALISLNLGMMNLLPIPALDGGRLVFLLIELVRRKPLKTEVEATINFVGLVLLMLLMLIVTGRDIVKLF